MATTFTWPLEGTTFKLLEGVHVDSVGNLRWMVILGGFLAFAMAWGIGANDVANAFATSVGAGSLSLRGACLIAAVMEFLGALLMGSNVTDTVRKKIIDVSVFDPIKDNGSQNGPEILMAGFLVALISATTWLILATYFSLPVSTTHSIIGSLIGVGLTFRGKDAVVWISNGVGFKKLKGVVGVVLSWIISPVLSGIFAIAVFLLVRTLVLRSKNPVRNGFLFLPFFYMITISVALFFIIYKGSPKLKLDKRFSVGQAVGISIGSGAVAGLLSWFFVVPQVRASVDRWEKKELERLGNPEAAAAAEEEAAEQAGKVNGILSKVGVNLDISEELGDDVIQMHDNVEKFDPKAERLFTWLQVFTAAFDAFAHGANDVANSIGPFASIYQLYVNRGVISAKKASKFGADGKFEGGAKAGVAFAEDDKVPDGKAYCGAIGEDSYYTCKANFPSLAGAAADAKSSKFDLYNDEGKLADSNVTCYSACKPGSYSKYSTKKQDVDLWILALGGVGIVLGLAMWGYRIIVAIGVKLTKLTPSRGFSIEIGAAITVIIASRIGLPVSTTHCQVGATMGVGLVEFKGNTVNWKQFAYICAGWVFTVVFTGFLASAIFALLINSPQKYAKGGFQPSHCPGDNLFMYDAGAKGFRGVACSGL